MMSEDEDEALRRQPDTGDETDDNLEMDELTPDIPLGRMGLPIRKRMSRGSEGRISARNRKSSVFEENAFHEILKERLHDTILQVVHADKSELEEEDDDVFEEPLTWKPSLVKQRVANTYKMVPDKEFDFAAVERRVDELLKDKLKFMEFNINSCKALTLSLSDDIRAIAKELAPDRFKLIARVFFGEMKNQGLTIASRFLWDPEHDSWCASLYRTNTFFVVGTVYAVYFE
uniref:dynein light chain Tctex-type protein 2-like isoform X1 n=1 Tax=Pristiophorus japonicus TaxID=55135 RepID=UPI00398F6ABB